MEFLLSPFIARVDQNMYVVIYHRNHLGIMNANPVPVTGPGAYSYDFTLSADQVYGGTAAQKEINVNVWGMIAGDGNGDGDVSNPDKNDVWVPQAG